MADINHIITLGIGTPGDLEHFILVGLNAAPSPELLPEADWICVVPADDWTVEA